MSLSKNNMAAYLTIKNLSLTIPDSMRSHTHILQDIDLVVNEGEFLVLLGPSGCGKSTLLRIIAGLETRPHKGSIVFRENYDSSRTSFVFQDFGLLPWLTVRENIELPLIGRAMLADERRDKVEAMIHRLGLDDAENSRPHNLSGGMKQRVGLARAFITDPELILLDEPFSELDFFTAKHLRNVLLELWDEKKSTTIIMVSHYIEEAVALADHVGVFSHRPGTIKTVIKDTLPRPRDIRATSFYTLEDEILSHFDVV
ncbi:ABC transporter ATP-binding protein [Candidatus Parcubacteria bacterium]|nr:ABC transporter ATP-binding protein [Candidatus Parcubacteria bacterium]